MKRWLIIAAMVALAGTAWAVSALFARQRALELRAAAEDACRRYDFLTAHARWLAYLKIRAADAEASLLAARCARRAEFLMDYTGPQAELLEAAAHHLREAERLGNPPADVALERSLLPAPHGQMARNMNLLLERLQGADDDALLILEALVHRHLRQLRFEEALLHVESLLQRKPDHALGLLWRARICEQFKQVRAAREDYEQALKLVPDFEPASYYLAESLLRSEQGREAETYLQPLIDRGTDHLLVHLAWAQCRIALGDTARGEELLDDWLARAPGKHPRRREALVARARVAQAAGKPRVAEAFARQALQESPLNKYALHVLALSLSAQERGPEAQAIQEQLETIQRELRTVARCREQLAKNPDDLSLRHAIGTAYLRVGRPAEALVWLHSVLARDPHHGPTLQALAQYHAQAGDQAAAAELRRQITRSMVSYK